MGRGHRATTTVRLPLPADRHLTPMEAVLSAVLALHPDRVTSYLLGRGWLEQFAVSQRLHPVIRAGTIAAPTRTASGHERGTYGRTHAALLAQLESFTEQELGGLEVLMRDAEETVRTPEGGLPHALAALRDLLDYLGASHQRSAERRQQVADRVSSLVLLDQYLLETTPAILARRRLADLRVRRGKDGPEARFGPLFMESARFHSWWIPQPWTSQARLAREYAAGYDMHGSLLYTGTNRRFWFGDCSMLSAEAPRVSTLFPQLVVINP